MPSSPPASASAGSARYSGGSAAIDAALDVRRVAQDQVEAARPRPQAVALAQRDAVGQAVALDVVRATASASR